MPIIVMGLWMMVTTPAPVRFAHLFRKIAEALD